MTTSLVEKDGPTQAGSDGLELDIEQSKEMIEHHIHDLKKLMQSAETTRELVRIPSSGN